MTQAEYKNHLSILYHELQVALGCTEPIAIALACAKARQTLGRMPDSCHVQCSGNIVKNVKGVIVPNSGGLRGIEVAAILGVLSGDADKGLAVLEGITEDDRAELRRLLKQEFCTCELIENVENLFIVVCVRTGKDTVTVELREQHNNITKITRNGEVLFEKTTCEPTSVSGGDVERISLKTILEFSDIVALADVEPILEKQVRFNSEISKEGLCGSWGTQVGKSLMQCNTSADFHIKARAAAAAGSDARMSGCSLPVVINCGSGNQGITVTMPIVEYARENNVAEEKMYRALTLANLIAVHQKKYIGRLSAYCGVVSAATASACGVAYMMLSGKATDEKIYQTIGSTITNSICTIGGMICDGAKSSCAAKISIAVENALVAMDQAMNQHVFQPGEGLTMENVEDTICAVGRMGNKGMRSTDLEILNIMLGK